MGQLLCCVQVDQSNVAVKEKFGKFSDVLGPGCHCLPWCFGYKLAGKLSLRVQQLDVRCETKTKVLPCAYYNRDENLWLNDCMIILSLFLFWISKSWV